MSGNVSTRTAPTDRPPFLSRADCQDLLNRLTRFTTGGGYTSVTIVSAWSGNVRWGRNQISTTGESSNNAIEVHRNIRGAEAYITVNDTTDAALVAAARRAERLVIFHPEAPNSNLIGHLPLESSSMPSLFDDATYHLDATQRAAVVHTIAQHAQEAGLLSAGYIETRATAMATLDTLGRLRYFPFTEAQCSITVRDSSGTASGWAGVDCVSWSKIDPAAVIARALDKCFASRKPVAIEPGRYTTILEPQAVSDFVGQFIRRPQGFPEVGFIGEQAGSPRGPFFDPASPTQTKLGQKVVDERITISADPMDPELGFMPFSIFRETIYDPFVTSVYHPATWIDHGVLTNLEYRRSGAIEHFGQNTGNPNSGAFRMSGGPTTIPEMIATTKRGLLVTRFDDVILADGTSQLYRGYTRDGLWLIEQGKISKAVKNLVFSESILSALNNVEQLGPSERVFQPVRSWRYGVPQPAIVPPLKIRDFSFTALSDAV